MPRICVTSLIYVSKVATGAIQALTANYLTLTFPILFQTHPPMVNKSITRFRCPVPPCFRHLRLGIKSHKVTYAQMHIMSVIFFFDFHDFFYLSNFIFFYVRVCPCQILFTCMFYLLFVKFSFLLCSPFSFGNFLMFVFALSFRQRMMTIFPSCAFLLFSCLFPSLLAPARLNSFGVS